MPRNSYLASMSDWD